MLEKIENIKSEINAFAIDAADSLEQFRLKFLSRKGLINDLFEDFKNVDKTQKGAVGKALNELKNLAQSKFDSVKEKLDRENSQGPSVDDYTLPGRTHNLGTKHLITQALEDITRIFERIGFKVAGGFEIEDEYYNFDALNTPDYHPSRDMQDTFYLDSEGKDKNYLLRTQTSPAQIHVMQNQPPPVRIISPGK
ncbi:MAG: phenylalanine--tRNA ligase subunit alpha, partial [Bacteroidetes bacterium]|nr:phenylalanine--tRNA ligase subunit alpha [Bacteroidota bacterium]